MSKLSSYERVLKTVKHERPDRTALSYTATSETHEKLKKHLKTEDDDEIYKRLGADIREVAGKYVGPKELSGAAGIGATGKDFWGVVREAKPYEGGFYNEIVYYPLGEATTVKEINDYSWPSNDWFDFSHLKAEIDRINREEKYAIKFFCGGAFESPWYMRGMERFLMDLVECPDIAEAISYNVSEFFLKRAKRAIEASEGRINIILSGGDIGTQRGMMLAPDLWRKHIKPYSEKLIKTFKDMGLITYYHSCGSLVPVIDDLIEMGLDILEPIQPKAEGMDPENLKKKFGGRLTFLGGIDEQELLPYGKPEDVKKEVERYIKILGSNGGYIVAPSHAIQPDTPMENILALYDAAKEYKYSS